MAVTILEERKIGGAAVRSTVLFADLRGYTSLAERLSPVAVVGLLEEFFAILAGPIARHGGTVFHSAGDSLMAGFGIDDESDAPLASALEAGRSIVAAFAPVSTRWERRYGCPTGVGVGLHVGEVALAEVGPGDCRRWTLIGDTVNVAARLCQRARAGEVLFSADLAEPVCAERASDVVALPDLTLRGRQSSVRIFCVAAAARIATGLVVQDASVRRPGTVA